MDNKLENHNHEICNNEVSMLSTRSRAVFVLFPFPFRFPIFKFYITNYKFSNDIFISYVNRNICPSDYIIIFYSFY